MLRSATEAAVLMVPTLPSSLTVLHRVEVGVALTPDRSLASPAPVDPAGYGLGHSTPFGW